MMKRYQQSIIEPFFEQLPLFFHENYLLCVVLQRILDFIGAWARHVEFEGDWVLLVAEAVSIIIDKHVIQLFLFRFSLIFYLTDWLLFTCYNVCYDLLEVFVIELWLNLLLLWPIDLLKFRLWLSQICSWSRNGIHGLLQFRVNSLSGLILEHTSRLSLLSGRDILYLILPIGEIKVVSEVIIIN